MTMFDIATQIESIPRSRNRRRASTPHARTRALAATAGAWKRTEQVLVYVSPATHEEMIKRAAELDVVVGGFAAYLIEMGIRKLFPAPRRARPNPLVPCACGCGTVFEQRDADSRPRRYVLGHNRKRAESGG